MDSTSIGDKHNVSNTNVDSGLNRGTVTPTASAASESAAGGAHPVPVVLSPAEEAHDRLYGSSMATQAAMANAKRLADTQWALRLANRNSSNKTEANGEAVGGDHSHDQRWVLRNGLDSDAHDHHHQHGDHNGERVKRYITAMASQQAQQRLLAQRDAQLRQHGESSAAANLFQRGDTRREAEALLNADDDAEGEGAEERDAEGLLDDEGSGGGAPHPSQITPAGPSAAVNKPTAQRSAAIVGPVFASYFKDSSPYSNHRNTNNGAKQMQRKEANATNPPSTKSTVVDKSKGPPSNANPSPSTAPPSATGASAPAPSTAKDKDKDDDAGDLITAPQLGMDHDELVLQFLLLGYGGGGTLSKENASSTTSAAKGATASPPSHNSANPNTNNSHYYSATALLQRKAEVAKERQRLMRTAYGKYYDLMQWERPGTEEDYQEGLEEVLEHQSMLRSQRSLLTSMSDTMSPRSAEEGGGEGEGTDGQQQKKQNPPSFYGATSFRYAKKGDDGASGTTTATTKIRLGIGRSGVLTAVEEQLAGGVDDVLSEGSFDSPRRGLHHMGEHSFSIRSDDNTDSHSMTMGPSDGGVPTAIHQKGRAPPRARGRNRTPSMVAADMAELEAARVRAECEAAVLDDDWIMRSQEPDAQAFYDAQLKAARMAHAAVSNGGFKVPLSASAQSNKDLIEYALQSYRRELQQQSAAAEKRDGDFDLDDEESSRVHNGQQKRTAAPTMGKRIPADIPFYAHEGAAGGGGGDVGVGEGSDDALRYQKEMAAIDAIMSVGDDGTNREEGDREKVRLIGALGNLLEGAEAANNKYEENGSADTDEEEETNADREAEAARLLAAMRKTAAEQHARSVRMERLQVGEQSRRWAEEEGAMLMGGVGGGDDEDLMAQIVPPRLRQQYEDSKHMAYFEVDTALQTQKRREGGGGGKGQQTTAAAVGSGAPPSDEAEAGRQQARVNAEGDAWMASQRAKIALQEERVRAEEQRRIAESAPTTVPMGDVASPYYFAGGAAGVNANGNDGKGEAAIGGNGIGRGHALPLVVAGPKAVPVAHPQMDGRVTHMKLLDTMYNSAERSGVALGAEGRGVALTADRLGPNPLDPPATDADVVDLSTSDADHNRPFPLPPGVILDDFRGKRPLQLLADVFGVSERDLAPMGHASGFIGVEELLRNRDQRLALEEGRRRAEEAHNAAERAAQERIQARIKQYACDSDDEEEGEAGGSQRTNANIDSTDGGAEGSLRSAGSQSFFAMTSPPSKTQTSAAYQLPPRDLIKQQLKAESNRQRVPSYFYTNNSGRAANNADASRPSQQQQHFKPKFDGSHNLTQTTAPSSSSSPAADMSRATVTTTTTNDEASFAIPLPPSVINAAFNKQYARDLANLFNKLHVNNVFHVTVEEDAYFSSHAFPQITNNVAILSPSNGQRLRQYYDGPHVMASRVATDGCEGSGAPPADGGSGSNARGGASPSAVLEDRLLKMARPSIYGAANANSKTKQSATKQLSPRAAAGKKSPTGAALGSVAAPAGGGSVASAAVSALGSGGGDDDPASGTSGTTAVTVSAPTLFTSRQFAIQKDLLENVILKGKFDLRYVSALECEVLDSVAEIRRLKRIVQKREQQVAEERRIRRSYEQQLLRVIDGNKRRKVSTIVRALELEAVMELLAASSSATPKPSARGGGKAMSYAGTVVGSDGGSGGTAAASSSASLLAAQQQQQQPPSAAVVTAAAEDTLADVINALSTIQSLKSDHEETIRRAAKRNAMVWDGRGLLVGFGVGAEPETNGNGNTVSSPSRFSSIAAPNSSRATITNNNSHHATNRSATTTHGNSMSFGSGGVNASSLMVGSSGSMSLSRGAVNATAPTAAAVGGTTNRVVPPLPTTTTAASSVGMGAPTIPQSQTGALLAALANSRRLQHRLLEAAGVELDEDENVYAGGGGDAESNSDDDDAEKGTGDDADDGSDEEALATHRPSDVSGTQTTHTAANKDGTNETKTKGHRASRSAHPTAASSAPPAMVRRLNAYLEKKRFRWALEDHCRVREVMLMEHEDSCASLFQMTATVGTVGLPPPPSLLTGGAGDEDGEEECGFGGGTDARRRASSSVNNNGQKKHRRSVKMVPASAFNDDEDDFFADSHSVAANSSSPSSPMSIVSGGMTTSASSILKKPSGGAGKKPVVIATAAAGTSNGSVVSPLIAKMGEDGNNTPAAINTGVVDAQKRRRTTFAASVHSQKQSAARFRALSQATEKAVATMPNTAVGGYGGFFQLGDNVYVKLQELFMALTPEQRAAVAHKRQFLPPREAVAPATTTETGAFGNAAAAEGADGNAATLLSPNGGMGNKSLPSAQGTMAPPGSAAAAAAGNNTASSAASSGGLTLRTDRLVPPRKKKEGVEAVGPISADDDGLVADSASTTAANAAKSSLRAGGGRSSSINHPRGRSVSVGSNGNNKRSSSRSPSAAAMSNNNTPPPPQLAAASSPLLKYNNGLYVEPFFTRYAELPDQFHLSDRAPIGTAAALTESLAAIEAEKAANAASSSSPRDDECPFSDPATNPSPTAAPPNATTLTTTAAVVAAQPVTANLYNDPVTLFGDGAECVCPLCRFEFDASKPLAFYKNLVKRRMAQVAAQKERIEALRRLQQEEEALAQIGAQVETGGAGEGGAKKKRRGKRKKHRNGSSEDDSSCTDDSFDTTDSDDDDSSGDSNADEEVVEEEEEEEVVAEDGTITTVKKRVVAVMKSRRSRKKRSQSRNDDETASLDASAEKSNKKNTDGDNLSDFVMPDEETAHALLSLDSPRGVSVRVRPPRSSMLSMQSDETTSEDRRERRRQRRREERRQRREEKKKVMAAADGDGDDASAKTKSATDAVVSFTDPQSNSRRFVSQSAAFGGELNLEKKSDEVHTLAEARLMINALQSVLEETQIDHEEAQSTILSHKISAAMNDANLREAVTKYETIRLQWDDHTKDLHAEIAQQNARIAELSSDFAEQKALTRRWKEECEDLKFDLMTAKDDIEAARHCRAEVETVRLEGGFDRWLVTTGATANNRPPVTAAIRNAMLLASPQQHLSSTQQSGGAAGRKKSVMATAAASVEYPTRIGPAGGGRGAVVMSTKIGNNEIEWLNYRSAPPPEEYVPPTALPSVADVPLMPPSADSAAEISAPPSPAPAAVAASTEVKKGAASSKSPARGGGKKSSPTKGKKKGSPSKKAPLAHLVSSSSGGLPPPLPPSAANDDDSSDQQPPADAADSPTAAKRTAKFPPPPIHPPTFPDSRDTPIPTITHYRDVAYVFYRKYYEISRQMERIAEVYPELFTRDLTTRGALLQSAFEEARQKAIVRESAASTLIFSAISQYHHATKRRGSSHGNNSNTVVRVHPLLCSLADDLGISSALAMDGGSGGSASAGLMLNAAAGGGGSGDASAVDRTKSYSIDYIAKMYKRHEEGGGARRKSTNNNSSLYGDDNSDEDEDDEVTVPVPDPAYSIASLRKQMRPLFKLYSQPKTYVDKGVGDSPLPYNPFYRGGGGGAAEGAVVMMKSPHEGTQTDCGPLGMKIITYGHLKETERDRIGRERIARAKNSASVSVSAPVGIGGGESEDVAAVEAAAEATASSGAAISPTLSILTSVNHPNASSENHHAANANPNLVKSTAHFIPPPPPMPNNASPYLRDLSPLGNALTSGLTTTSPMISAVSIVDIDGSVSRTASVTAANHRQSVAGAGGPFISSLAPTITYGMKEEGTQTYVTVHDSSATMTRPMDCYQSSDEEDYAVLARGRRRRLTREKLQAAARRIGSYVLNAKRRASNGSSHDASRDNGASANSAANGGGEWTHERFREESFAALNDGRSGSIAVSTAGGRGGGGLPLPAVFLQDLLQLRAVRARRNARNMAALPIGADYGRMKGCQTFVTSVRTLVPLGEEEDEDGDAVKKVQQLALMSDPSFNPYTEGGQREIVCVARHNADADGAHGSVSDIAALAGVDRRYQVVHVWSNVGSSGVRPTSVPSGSIVGGGSTTSPSAASIAAISDRHSLFNVAGNGLLPNRNDSISINNDASNVSAVFGLDTSLSNKQGTATTATASSSSKAFSSKRRESSADDDGASTPSKRRSPSNSHQNYFADAPHSPTAAAANRRSIALSARTPSAVSVNKSSSNASRRRESEDAAARRRRKGGGKADGMVDSDNDGADVMGSDSSSSLDDDLPRRGRRRQKSVSTASVGVMAMLPMPSAHQRDRSSLPWNQPPTPLTKPPTAVNHLPPPPSPAPNVNYQQQLANYQHQQEVATLMVAMGRRFQRIVEDSRVRATRRRQHVALQKGRSTVQQNNAATAAVANASPTSSATGPNPKQQALTVANGANGSSSLAQNNPQQQLHSDGATSIEDGRTTNVTTNPKEAALMSAVSSAILPFSAAVVEDVAKAFVAQSERDRRKKIIIGSTNDASGRVKHTAVAASNTTGTLGFSAKGLLTNQQRNNNGGGAKSSTFAAVASASAVDSFSAFAAALEEEESAARAKIASDAVLGMALPMWVWGPMLLEIMSSAATLYANNNNNGAGNNSNKGGRYGPAKYVSASHSSNSSSKQPHNNSSRQKKADSESDANANNSSSAVEKKMKSKKRSNTIRHHHVTDVDVFDDEARRYGKGELSSSSSSASSSDSESSSSSDSLTSSSLSDGLRNPSHSTRKKVTLLVGAEERRNDQRKGRKKKKNIVAEALQAQQAAAAEAVRQRVAERRQRREALLQQREGMQRAKLAEHQREQQQWEATATERLQRQLLQQQQQQARSTNPSEGVAAVTASVVPITAGTILPPPPPLFTNAPLPLSVSNLSPSATMREAAAGASALLAASSDDVHQLSHSAVLTMVTARPMVAPDLSAPQSPRPTSNDGPSSNNNGGGGLRLPPISSRSSAAVANDNDATAPLTHSPRMVKHSVLGAPSPPANRKWGTSMAINSSSSPVAGGGGVKGRAMGLLWDRSPHAATSSAPTILSPHRLVPLSATFPAPSSSAVDPDATAHSAAATSSSTSFLPDIAPRPHSHSHAKPPLSPSKGAGRRSVAGVGGGESLLSGGAAAPPSCAVAEGIVGPDGSIAAPSSSSSAHPHSLAAFDPPTRLMNTGDGEGILGDSSLLATASPPRTASRPNTEKGEGGSRRSRGLDDSGGYSSGGGYGDEPPPSTADRSGSRGRRAAQRLGLSTRERLMASGGSRGGVGLSGLGGSASDGGFMNVAEETRLSTPFSPMAGSSTVMAMSNPLMASSASVSRDDTAASEAANKSPTQRSTNPVETVALPLPVAPINVIFTSAPPLVSALARSASRDLMTTADTNNRSIGTATVGGRARKKLTFADFASSSPRVAEEGGVDSPLGMGEVPVAHASPLATVASTAAADLATLPIGASSSSAAAAVPPQRGAALAGMLALAGNDLLDTNTLSAIRSSTKRRPQHSTDRRPVGGDEHHEGAYRDDSPREVGSDAEERPAVASSSSPRGTTTGGQQLLFQPTAISSSSVSAAAPSAKKRTPYTSAVGEATAVRATTTQKVAGGGGGATNQRLISKPIAISRTARTDATLRVVGRSSSTRNKGGGAVGMILTDDDDDDSAASDLSPRERLRRRRMSTNNGADATEDIVAMVDEEADRIALLEEKERRRRNKARQQSKMTRALEEKRRVLVEEQAFLDSLARDQRREKEAEKLRLKAEKKRLKRIEHGLDADGVGVAPEDDVSDDVSDVVDPFYSDPHDDDAVGSGDEAADEHGVRAYLRANGGAAAEDAAPITTAVMLDAALVPLTPLLSRSKQQHKDNNGRVAASSVGTADVNKAHQQSSAGDAAVAGQQQQQLEHADRASTAVTMGFAPNDTLDSRQKRDAILAVRRGRDVGEVRERAFPTSPTTPSSSLQRQQQKRFSSTLLSSSASVGGGDGGYEGGLDEDDDDDDDDDDEMSYAMLDEDYSTQLLQAARLNRRRQRHEREQQQLEQLELEEKEKDQQQRTNTSTADGGGGGDVSRAPHPSPSSSISVITNALADLQGRSDVHPETKALLSTAAGQGTIAAIMASSHATIGGGGRQSVAGGGPFAASSSSAAGERHQRRVSMAMVGGTLMTLHKHQHQQQKKLLPYQAGPKFSSSSNETSLSPEALAAIKKAAAATARLRAGGAAAAAAAGMHRPTNQPLAVKAVYYNTFEETIRRQQNAEASDDDEKVMHGSAGPPRGGDDADQQKRNQMTLSAARALQRQRQQQGSYRLPPNVSNTFTNLAILPTNANPSRVSSEAPSASMKKSIVGSTTVPTHQTVGGGAGKIAALLQQSLAKDIIIGGGRGGGLVGASSSSGNPPLTLQQQSLNYAQYSAAASASIGSTSSAMAVVRSPTPTMGVGVGDGGGDTVASPTATPSPLAAANAAATAPPPPPPPPPPPSSPSPLVQLPAAFTVMPPPVAHHSPPPPPSKLTDGSSASASIVHSAMNSGTSPRQGLDARPQRGAAAAATALSSPTPTTSSPTTVNKSGSVWSHRKK